MSGTTDEPVELVTTTEAPEQREAIPASPPSVEFGERSFTVREVSGLIAGEEGQVVHDLTWADGRFLAVGLDNEWSDTDVRVGAAVWTSSDGLTWERVPHDPEALGGFGRADLDSVTAMLSVTHWEGAFYAVGNYYSAYGEEAAAIWRSPDGNRWERVLVGEPGTGGSSLAGRSDWLVVTGYDASFDAAIWVSGDGIRWDVAPLVSEGGERYWSAGPVVALPHAFVAAPILDLGERKPEIAVSEDGKSWRFSILPDTEAGPEERVSQIQEVDGWALAITRGDSAVGGVVWVSLNGADWTRVAQFSDEVRGSIVWTPDGWFNLSSERGAIVGRDSTLRWSADLETWEIVAELPGFGGSLVTANGMLFIVGGRNFLNDPTAKVSASNGLHLVPAVYAVLTNG